MVGSRERAGHLYRIAQEAIANAARHGRARAVAITVSRDGDMADLTVEDDGLGISDTALAGGKGLGLRTMRYRVEWVGGALQVRQRDEGGGPGPASGSSRGQRGLTYRLPSASSERRWGRLPGDRERPRG